MELLTVKEVAKEIKTNTNYVYKLIRSGKLVGIALGSMKVSKDSLERFIEQYQGYDLSNPDEPKPIC